jgi:protein-serine/threonine kinase
MDGSGGLAIIKQGPVGLPSKNPFQQWKTRYLILRKDILDFHKNENGKLLYKIQLSDVVSVDRVPDDNGDPVFEIRRHLNSSYPGPPGDDDDGIRSLRICVKTDDELYEWIDCIYARCPSGVGNPTNFSHAVHVGFNPQTGQFTGLPEEWTRLLNSSAITKEDVEKNPRAVYEVLDFYTLTRRNEEQEMYGKPMAMPSSNTVQSEQFGYSSGNSVAPPRQVKPIQRGPASYPTTPSPAPGPSPSARSSPGEPQASQTQQLQNVSPNYISADRMREEQRARELERQRAEREEQARRELEAYNASLPKTKVPLAQQEIGGGYSSPSPPSADRFNPTRAAPKAPPAQSLRAQRPPPPAPAGSSIPSRNAPQAQQSSSSPARDPAAQAQRTQRPDQANGPSAAARYPNGSPAMRGPNGQTQAQQPSRLPAPVKPLNVTKPQQDGGVKAAEAALSKPAQERKQDVRMSTMSENEVMAKLREVVSKDDPNRLYAKQKKIGQGASGSVYVAKVMATRPGAPAKPRPNDRVAIKQMDLAHQPRKELIVNEILVMRENKHANIVNFLDAFLMDNDKELWVVMEYMEGGALTDVIENNPVITEEQISTICLEVRVVGHDWLLVHSLTCRIRHAKASSTFTHRTLSTATSRATTFFWTPGAMSRLVRQTHPPWIIF